MNKKEIKNSPGYFITENGEVYNSENKRLKTFYKKDGYERIRLLSLEHNGKRVNRSVHLLVACEFLNIGKYAKKNILQVNHIDGNKKNNHKDNLEEMTQTENVNHAHDNDLYTYNLKIKVRDTLLKETLIFRSVIELSRHLNVSLNYIRPRIVISRKYPILNRYVMFIDFKRYINHISKIKNHKKIFVYDHLDNKEYLLTSYTQISILFGISDIVVSRKLKDPDIDQYYSGGYTFSNKQIPNFKSYLTRDIILKDRDVIWKKLAMSEKNVGLKRGSGSS